MLLVIDMGNTDIAFGVFDGDELKVTWHMATTVHRMPDEYAMMLLNLLNHHGIGRGEVTSVAMCSVVPPLVGTFVDMFHRYFNIVPLVVGAGVKTGVQIRADNPREVGADRIVNAAAAQRLYGGPLIVTDMGTATTFDVISCDGDYIGGVIAPGIAMASEALTSRTAKLPSIELIAPKQVIGTNTIMAMQSGVIYGYVGLVENIIGRIRCELGEKVKVVATGGYSRVIAKETAIFDVLNPNLTLTGLKIIHGLNRD